METTGDQAAPAVLDVQDSMLKDDPSPVSTGEQVTGGEEEDIEDPTETGVHSRNLPEEQLKGGEEDLKDPTKTGVLSHDLTGIAASTVAQAAKEREQSKEVKTQSIIFLACIAFLGAIVTTAVFLPRSLNKKYVYRNCNDGKIDFILKRIGDGICDRDTSSKGINLNTKECRYDGGDCKKFNKLYKNCVPGTDPSKLKDFGQGVQCNTDYNTEECGYDAGNCIEFNEKYPNCKADSLSLLFDNYCSDYEPYNTKECGWDGGACLIPSLPNCTGINPRSYKNGDCDAQFLSEECNYDGGDCKWVLENYPNCRVEIYWYLNSSYCRNDDNYNTEECGWQNGVCNEFNKHYPMCKAQFPGSYLNDSSCFNNPSYNTEECGYDGGDCIEFNKLYPKCTAIFAHYLNDGMCYNYETYNTEECGYDGGDCIEFNKLYPKCTARLAYKLNDGSCDNADPYNTEECGWDGGDCLEFNARNAGYPDCEYYENIGRDCCNLSKMSDGFCDEENNMDICDFDGGDCN